jgi:small subunit ribosomal protein S1
VPDRRIEHPQDVLRAGQIVRTQVIDLDREKRQFKLSMKRLIPTSLDEYMAERKVGDIVTARIVSIESNTARVELGEGIFGTCSLPASSHPSASEAPAKVDLSSLSSMLKARWKGDAPDAPRSTALASGQVRTFRLASIEPANKKIELTLE